MERVHNLDIENRELIKNIISSGSTTAQKRKELSIIKLCYIRDYCIDEKKVVKFTNNIVVSVDFLEAHVIKKEFIDIAINDLVLHRDEDNPTILDLLDYCLEKNLIEMGYSVHYYRKKDLDRMLSKNITYAELFLEDRDYLLKSPPTNINLRNWCFMEGLIKSIDLKKPPKICSYYEKLLNFKTSIVRRKKTYVYIHAIGKGYNENEKKSYFDFLKKQKYPDTLEEYLQMNEIYNDNGKNRIDIYNEGIEDSYNWVLKNILSIRRYPYGHSKFNSTLHYYILKTHYPSVLKRIKCSKKNIYSQKIIFCSGILRNLIRFLYFLS